MKSFDVRVFCSHFSLVTACIVGAWCQAPLVAQPSGSPFATETTLVSQPAGRAISDILLNVQSAFLKPITYEEYPFRTNREQNFGAIVTLGPNDSSAYLAVQTVLGDYQTAGFPGQYTVNQTGARIDVMPAHGPAAPAASWKPLMSYPVSFRFGARSIEETLTLLVDQIANESGYRVILLDFPGSEADRIQLSAENRLARDLIDDIGEKMNLTLSFQALYQPDSKLYYLRVVSVAAPNGAGEPPRSGRIKPLPKLGPANSPFFIKDK